MMLEMISGLGSPFQGEIRGGMRSEGVALGYDGTAFQAVAARDGRTPMAAVVAACAGGSALQPVLLVHEPEPASSGATKR